MKTTTKTLFKPWGFLLGLLLVVMGVGALLDDHPCETSAYRMRGAREAVAVLAPWQQAGAAILSVIFGSIIVGYSVGLMKKWDK